MKVYLLTKWDRWQLNHYDLAVFEREEDAEIARKKSEERANPEEWTFNVTEVEFIKSTI